MKKYPLNHKPTPPLPPPSPQEAREMMHDVFLMNLEQYSAAEIAQAIKEGIVTLPEVEECLSPSHS